MSLFSGPEHASYIALMRYLKLERKFLPGDWFLSFDEWGGPGQEPFVRLAYPDTIQVGDRLVTRLTEAKATRLAVWLPREDQWLSMLEGLGANTPEFGMNNGRYVVHRGAPDQHGVFVHGEAATRVEALARLWMIVAAREDLP